MFDYSEYRVEFPRTFSHIIDPIVCKDGFQISVQVSKYHYCSPRSENGPWTMVEIGYPSDDSDMDLLEPYRESDDSQVFPYVPVEIAEAIIDRHGGLAQSSPTD